MTDLFELTATLVDIPSVSHGEAAIADFVESRLRALDGLEVARIGDNVCARTNTGRQQRLLFAGHLDTVPVNGNDRAVTEGDVLRGLGAADMKGGVAVFLDVADQAAAAAAGGSGGLAADLSFVFYVCEEVDQRFSGLPQIAAADASWLEADAAILGEPTACTVEAGCQGVLRVLVETVGERAHTARPWMGRNAVHRLAPLLDRIARFEERKPIIDGCEYREALQAVKVEGGVANNVVPDRGRVWVNHRFAPDRTADEAFAAVTAFLQPALDLAAGDSIVLEDRAAPAAPGLGHPLLAGLVEQSGAPPRAKLGWTDVSYFAARGVPAANFGPGEPTVAHTAGEWVSRADLERAWATLRSLVMA